MKVFVFFVCFVSAVFCAEKICGGTYRGFQYTITSPNYPSNYSGQHNCIYRLQGDTWEKCEQEFHLQFLDFNVKSSDNCEKDYLQIGDRYIFCGKIAGLRKFTGVNNSLSVVFHSDQRNSDKGFKILVTAVPCILKFNHNHFYRGFTEEGRDDFAANDIPTNTDYREINGGLNSEDNSSGTRFSLLTNNFDNSSSVAFPSSKGQKSLTQQMQINFPTKKNLSINSFPSSSSWSSLETSNQHIPRISSYIFVPPTKNNTSIDNNLSKITNNKFLNTVTSPPNEFSLPSQNSILPFSNTRLASDKNALGSLDKSSSSSEQIRKTVTIPSRNYGEPGLSVVDYDLQVANDCDVNIREGSSIRNNYNSLQDQTFIRPVDKLGSYSNIVYDPNHGFVDAHNDQGINNPLQSYPNRYPSNYPNKVLPIGYPSSINNPFTNYPNGINSNNQVGNVYNPNLGSTNYPIGGYYPHNNNPSYLNYHSYSNIGNSLGYNSGYNHISHSSTRYPIISNYNSGYNSGFTSGFTPSFGGNYYPNYDNSWNNGFGQDRECCRIQSSRRFSLVSPGFPGGISSSGTFGCRYTITKASPDICRLRLSFRFFNFGADDQYCSYGYVEVDGRRYCGCKTGHNIQIPFTDYIAKSIFIMYSGYPRTKFSGFLIDVVQESCGISGSYPSYPSYPFYPSNQLNPSYPYDLGNPNYPNYSGYYQRRKDALRPTLGKRNVPNSWNVTLTYPSQPDPNPHIRNKRNLGYSYSKPSIPFPSNKFQSVSTVIGTRDRFYDESCQNRIFLDWAIASKEAILKHIRCGGFGISNPNTRINYFSSRNSRSLSTDSSECEESSIIQGEITTPLYPNNYPDNLKKCYRFNKVSNYCKMEMNVRDFDVEQSQECSKDYLKINKEDKKYCGNSLKNFKTIFDLTQVNFVDVYFVSDSFGTGRGFNISFSQLPCGESPNF